jgi:hypothetical protein
MTDPIYFIKLLADALQGPNIAEPLAMAFRRILELRHKPAYASGYAQFTWWMRAVARAAANVDGPIPKDPPGIEQNPDPLGFVLCGEMGPVVAAAFDPRGSRWVAENVRPGRYQLIAETGWLIHEFELAREEVTWPETSAASWRMAADDGSSVERPSRVIKLPPLRCEIRVYRGREADM